MKTLASLFDSPEYRWTGDAQTSIDDIVFDSRQVRPGVLFVALRGARQDGHAFIPGAIKAGASAILAEEPAPAGVTVPWLQVANSLLALSQIAPRFWDHPSQMLLTVGITGTNGKTTSSYMMESLFEAAGWPTGVLGTINYRFGKNSRPAPNTTPFASDLQRFIASVRDQGGKACVMEVSSHALSLGRVEGVDFDIALFTNLTQDHLDFHKTMENYAAAKALLFKTLTPQTSKPYPRRAVVNADDPWTDRLVRDCGVLVIRYGLEANADVRARDIHCDAKGSDFIVEFGTVRFPIHITLVGDYNVTNALGVAAVGCALGLSPGVIQRGLASFQVVPGRMENVENDHSFSVVVDYAHTEDALRKVMDSLRKLQPAHLITVFGCGGDRDRTKRPLMGQAAVEMSDWVIVTSDNPRSEDPAKIALDVEVGIRRAATDRYETILDRESAIHAALTRARSGDIVLIAGKGHETYQLVGAQTLTFDDREVARRILESLPHSA
jgi:UDP-N-acetylmuramoyl-L-alanyl-D-glutamate--2,6-diaminopimelate ligase